MRLTEVASLLITIGSFAFFAGLIVGHQGWLAP